MNRTIVNILAMLIIGIILVFSVSTIISTLKNKSEIKQMEQQINELQNELKEVKGGICRENSALSKTK